MTDRRISGRRSQQESNDVTGGGNEGFRRKTLDYVKRKSKELAKRAVNEISGKKEYGEMTKQKIDNMLLHARSPAGDNYISTQMEHNGEAKAWLKEHRPACEASGMTRDKIKEVTDSIKTLDLAIRTALVTGENTEQHIPDLQQQSKELMDMLNTVYTIQLRGEDPLPPKYTDLPTYSDLT